MSDFKHYKYKKNLKVYDKNKKNEPQKEKQDNLQNRQINQKKPKRQYFLKKGRIIFTVMFTAFTFTLIGLIISLYTFNEMKSITNVLIKKNEETVILQKESYINSETFLGDKLDIEQTDIDYLNDKYDFLKLNKIYPDRLTISNKSGNLYYFNQSFGHLKMNESDFLKLGLKLDGSYPKNNDEIAITRYQAECMWFINQSSESLNDYIANLIETELTTSSDVYKITGIIDAGNIQSKYNNLKENTDSEYEIEFKHYLIRTYNNYVFANTNFSLKNIGNEFNDFYYSENYRFLYINTAVLKKFQPQDKEQVIFFDNKETLNDNEMLLPINDRDIKLEIFDFWSGEYNYDEEEYGMTAEAFEYQINYHLYENVELFKKFLSDFKNRQYFLTQLNKDKEIGYEIYNDGWENHQMKIAGLYVKKYSNTEIYPFILNDKDYNIITQANYHSNDRIQAIGLLPQNQKQLLNFVKENLSFYNDVRFNFVNDDTQELMSLKNVFCNVANYITFFTFVLMFICFVLYYKLNKRRSLDLKLSGKNSNILAFNSIMLSISSIIAIVQIYLILKLLNWYVSYDLSVNANFFF